MNGRMLEPASQWGEPFVAKIKKKAKGKKKSLSPEERAQRNLQRRHRREIRETFAAVGFQRVESASDKEFT